MTIEAHHPTEELRRMVASGQISEDALQTITGIQPEHLQSFLEESRAGMVRPTAGGPQYLSEEGARLSILSAQLTEVSRIDDDDRLKAIFEALTMQCRLTASNLTELIGLDIDDIQSAVRDPRTIPVEKKYQLAIRGSYLINAINQARGH